MTAPSLGAGLVNPCRKREGKADCFEPNEAARPLPARILRFPHLRRRGRPTSARVADQTVERDWRQAMPRAEPALSRAPLRLSAVVGAAISTGITTPVTPSGPPPRTADTPLKGVLGTGRVSWEQPPSGYPWESPGADLALRHAHCHDAAHRQRFAHERPEGEKWRGGR